MLESGESESFNPGERRKFPENAPDSEARGRLKPASAGTRLSSSLQSDIPNGQGEMYTQGWQDHYFDPMLDYFGKLPPKAKSKSKPSASPTKKAPKKNVAAAGKKSSAAKPSKKANAAPTARAKKKASEKARRVDVFGAPYAPTVA